MFGHKVRSLVFVNYQCLLMRALKKTCYVFDFVLSFLARTQLELKSTKEQKEQMTKEKDETIAELEDKIRNMEFSYENMLHVSMDIIHIMDWQGGH